MAHFQMSTGGSKSNEHVDHFLVDIHNQRKFYEDYLCSHIPHTSNARIYCCWDIPTLV